MKTILVDAVNTFVTKRNGIYEPMHELLETYSNRKIILTGANDEQMVKFGLNNMPYEIFTLKHDPEKVDPIYFERMFLHFDLSKDEVIYFEHNVDAVRTAQSVGITSYHYDSEAQNMVGLKQFLDQNT